MKIDAHQHFWIYHPVKDAWITDDMKILQQNFLPKDLWPLLQQNNIDGCVAVQADQSETETNFLLELAEKSDFIKGVVGWVDLLANNIEERLAHYSQFKKLKGFRHIVQAEPNDLFLLDKDFCRGISFLEKYHFTYDILIFPKQLPAAVEFAQQFPNQKFVVDHLAKPDFKAKEFDGWEKRINEIARNKNVFCKVSGLVTEADWSNWKQEDFSYCLQVVRKAFGVDRLMFGSDWPVCQLAASYHEVCKIIDKAFADCSELDLQKIWGDNAINFYNL